MENIVNKIKSYFSSNFGKLTAVISGLTFIITLMLSVLFKNRIDISIFKALISAIITMIILYGLNIFLVKYLGDIIEDSESETTIPNSEDSLNASSNNYSQEESKEETSLPNPNDILNDTKPENSMASIIDDIPKPNDTVRSDFNIDKNNKSSYHNMRGDIGDIILGSSSYDGSNYSSGISDSGAYYNSDAKINEKNIEREVMEDPEKTASAIRTLLAKDKKEEKK